MLGFRYALIEVGETDYFSGITVMLKFHVSISPLDSVNFRHRIISNIGRYLQE